MKIYFLIGFLVTLCSLCFCCNIAKDKFIIYKFVTIRKFDFFTKKNIGLRLVGDLDLWTENNKTETKPLLQKKIIIERFLYFKNLITRKRR